ncbi:hypothetical protein BDZ90DRAFT_176071 [Jaminaea rosea]|uniref:Uncharacterized protein n=1 Tax=Jaminaea rosea TaxID=1569628 RepID=A0A316UPX5_9BASI|nr:hypothetical protein BDZ90DRAFT_176071 [Jaminaea rosea]PWN27346.1 hypothetical protein BDZ90DRAFT_176071 [Jaminaea rosea]
MTFSRFLVSSSRAALAARPATSAHLARAAPLSTSAIRLSKPTESEQASKAHHHERTPEELQHETARSHAKERNDESKMSSSPNDTPTESEDVAHAHRNHEHESPETLAHKTTKKVWESTTERSQGKSKRCHQVAFRTCANGFTSNCISHSIDSPPFCFPLNDVRAADRRAHDKLVWTLPRHCVRS